MSDFGQSLLANVSKRFNENIRSDRRIRQIAKRVRDGTDYSDAQEYAERLGELLSEALLSETGTLSYMSGEVARELLYPLLSEDHALECEAINTIQQNIYSQAGVGLNPVIPQLDTNRIDGLIDKISGYTEFADARWVLEEPIVNFTQAISDQAIRDNAKRSAGVGLETKIIRKAESPGIRSRRIGKKTYQYRVPCKWCSSLSRSWDYGDEPDDVYRRHAFCRCTVTYTVGGQRQDVWSKKQWSEDDAKAKREQISDMEQRLAQDRARLNQRTIIDSLTVTNTGAKKILTDYKDEIARDGLLAVIDKLKQDQSLLNTKYRSKR